MSLPEPLPSIAEASRLIEAGRLSPIALVDAALARAAGLNDTLNAFIRILPERARRAAADAECEIRAGRLRGPLHGIPYGLKDIYDVAGVATTAHSRLLLNNIAERDAAATARLEAAGMVLIGKLATHEFATGGPAWDLPWPPARNPWNTAHFTGGSSSGSGAAVAAGILPLALGTDTGGSIRMPAAWCGSVGLKPTYGRISRRGVVPLSFSLDTCGPLTRTVEDCALVLQALAGYDPLDPASSPAAVPNYSAELRAGVAGLSIGYATAFNQETGVGPEERSALDAAAARFSELGARVAEVVLPPVDHFHASGRAILNAESFVLHRQNLVERPGDYARVTRERLMLGAFVSGAQYVQAQRLRRLLSNNIDALLARCDALLVAPVPGPALRLDQVDTSPWRKEQPLTTVFNVTGHPALCQPCGFSATGLPLALQLVAAPFAETTLLRVAHAYEQATEWHLKRPPEIPYA
ncbi:MAG: amidase [Acetobacteraceae bacterium]